MWRSGFAEHMGSSEAFTAVFGNVLPDEFWLSAAAAEQHVLRRTTIPQASQSGYIFVLTERAMLGWNSAHGAFMLPLGQIYYNQDTLALKVNAPLN